MANKELEQLVDNPNFKRGLRGFKGAEDEDEGESKKTHLVFENTIPASDEEEDIFRFHFTVCGQFARRCIISRNLPKVTCSDCLYMLQRLQQVSTYQEALQVIPEAQLSSEEQRIPPKIKDKTAEELKAHIIGKNPEMFWANMLNLRLVEPPQQLRDRRVKSQPEAGDNNGGRDTGTDPGAT